MNTQVASLAEALTTLQADVQAEDTVVDSAVALINGFPALLAAAVMQAIEAGASAEQLAPFGQLADDIVARSQHLAAAVANSPGGAGVPKQTGTPAPV